MYARKLVYFTSGLCIDARFRCMASAVGVASCVRSSRTVASWSAEYKQHINLSKQHGSCRHLMAISCIMRHGVHSIRTMSHSTLDPSEAKKFQLLANKWWNEHGEFAALHSMNDLRVPFIRDNLLNVHGGRQWGRPLSGIRILDVGCGGGLLTEPLGRLGADVVGVDPVEDSIRTAELHSSFDPVLRERIRYRACTLEEISEEEAEGFDAVVASEVVEHLADLDTFAICCNQVLKPGGSLFITTINKTNLSYALGIVAAERVLRIVPSGTHEWDKFISPVELERLLESNGLFVESVRGMLFNPLFGSWSWTQSTSINYALHAVKQREEPQPDHARTPADPEDHTADTDTRTGSGAGAGAAAGAGQN